MKAKKVIGTTFYAKTINPDISAKLILTDFFGQFRKGERQYTWFQQGSATAHNAHDFLTALERVFGDWIIISHGLWPARSPDLTPCDFYLWGNLKDKIYRTNPHTEVELKKNVQREILNVSQEEILRSNSKPIKRCTENMFTWTALSTTFVIEVDLLYFL
jgi:hypothetical protein